METNITLCLTYVRIRTLRGLSNGTIVVDLELPWRSVLQAFCLT